MAETPKIQRQAALSPAMRDAIALLNKIKAKGDRAITNSYNALSVELEAIAAKAMKRGKWLKSDTEAVAEWSKKAAKARNTIITATLEASFNTANTYAIAEMLAAWGVADSSARAKVASSIIADIKKQMAVGAGEEMGMLSSRWWQDGFSVKGNQSRLIKQIATNTVLGKDAVKAGKELVKSKLIKTPEAIEKYLQNLVDMAEKARKANMPEFYKELQKAKKRVAALRGQIMSTPEGQRASLLTRPRKQRLLREIEKFVKGGSREQFAASLKKYGVEQATQNAITLQRSATNSVFQARVRSWTTENPEFIKYIVWQLAPARRVKRPGPCDEYARKRWKPEEVPPYPHYNCACTLQPILISAKEHAKLLAEGG